MAVDLNNKKNKTRLLRLKVNMLAIVEGKLTQCGVDSRIEVDEAFGNQCIAFQQAEWAEKGDKPKVEECVRSAMKPPVDGNTGVRFPSWDAYYKHLELISRPAKVS